MKSGLKRIEATLGQLNTQGNATDDQSETPQDFVASTGLSKPKSAAKPKSTAKVAIQPFPLPKEPARPQTNELPQANETVELAKSQPVRGTAKTSTKAKKEGTQKKTKAGSEVVKPFSSRSANAETPTLPKAKPPSFSNHRHAVNPNLAVGLLKEVEAIVVRWQLDLEQTVLEIQALYMEGPIVDGWLESHPYGSPQVMQPIGTATLRHAEIDRLMDYVEEICRVPQTLDPGEIPRTGYRLCGLDADGQMWSRPCPPQQVPYVSLAIARYQKLRILLAKKQNLENRLNQLIQNLTMLHGLMQEPS